LRTRDRLGNRRRETQASDAADRVVAIFAKNGTKGFSRSAADWDRPSTMLTASASVPQRIPQQPVTSYRATARNR